MKPRNSILLKILFIFIVGLIIVHTTFLYAKSGNTFSKAKSGEAVVEMVDGTLYIGVKHNIFGSGMMVELKKVRYPRTIEKVYISMFQVRIIYTEPLSN